MVRIITLRTECTRIKSSMHAAWNTGVNFTGPRHFAFVKLSSSRSSNLRIPSPHAFLFTSQEEGYRGHLGKSRDALGNCWGPRVVDQDSVDDKFLSEYSGKSIYILFVFQFASIAPSTCLP